MPLNFIKKFLSPSMVKKMESALLFRPEDPNGLIQVLPPTLVNTTVERIKGNRYPSPGSRPPASVPILESSDDIYNTNYLSRDPRNLQNNDVITINSKTPVTFTNDVPRLISHGKRNIALLDYDKTGLRTSKTATWANLAPVLEQRARPNHLPTPAWQFDKETLEEVADRKGIPVSFGKRYKMKMSPNYTQIRW